MPDPRDHRLYNARVRMRLGWWGYMNVRDRLMRDQDNTCYYCCETVYGHWSDAPDKLTCETKIATIDHIDPISRGGSWKRHNLCIACKACNTRKGSLSEEAFHAVLMAAEEACEDVEDMAA